jgi:hypothetical protein
MIEEKYSLADPSRRGVYSFDGARFTRVLVLPEAREYDATEIANAINSYVALLDGMLNAYFAGHYRTELDMEKDYLRRLNAMPIHV